MAGVIQAKTVRVFLGQLAQFLAPLTVILQLVVLVTVGAKDDQCALCIALSVRIERCLIRNRVLYRHVQVELKLRHKALFIPQPDNEAVVWLS